MEEVSGPKIFTHEAVEQFKVFFIECYLNFRRNVGIVTNVGLKRIKTAQNFTSVRPKLDKFHFYGDS